MNHERIISHFGEDFYKKLLLSLQKYSDLWNLSEFEQIGYYSINCIFQCTSRKYGNCVLKIGKHYKEMQTEYETLLQYSGTAFCRIYEADISKNKCAP